MGYAVARQGIAVPGRVGVVHRIAMGIIIPVHTVPVTNRVSLHKAPTYGPAIAELKAEGKCLEDMEHRQVKYLNNVERPIMASSNA